MLIIQTDMSCKSCTTYGWKTCHTGPCSQFWTDYNVIGLAYPIITDCKEKKNLGADESNKTINNVVEKLQ